MVGGKASLVSWGGAGALGWAQEQGFSCLRTLRPGPPLQRKWKWKMMQRKKAQEVQLLQHHSSMLGVLGSCSQPWLF